MNWQELKFTIEKNQNLGAALNTLKMFKLTPEDYKLYLESGLDADHMIEVRSVKSSNINQLTFDGNKKKMLVEFKNGGAYEYDEVPHETYKEMCEAESVGKYFQMHVRGRFQYRKVR